MLTLAILKNVEFTQSQLRRYAIMLGCHIITMVNQLLIASVNGFIILVSLAFTKMQAVLVEYHEFI